MSHEDFDINGLATYLHLTRDQVLKLVERGKLPGRRIAGQWRFARAEVHHWWEERIGNSGAAELAQVETVLQRTGQQVGDDISLAESLPVEAIAIPLAARTRSSVIIAMAELAGQTGNLWDVARMEEAVRARENLHPTALDNGVALLHPRRPLGAILSEPFLALGITSQGIPFSGSRMLTDVFFLICSTEDRWHLRTLARLSRLLADESFLEQLRGLGNPADVPPLFEEYETNLLDRP
jgi:PTS system nitrogen regulatory IIA component